MKGKNLKIGPQTKIYGLIGNPVEHTFSPYMHNSAFGSIGIDAIYLAWQVEPENLSGAIEGLRTLGLSGANVTVPYKEKVLPLLDWVNKEAKLIGAVNTIVRKEGRLLGYNTDGTGFIKSLKADGHIDSRGKRVFMFGAGGAARSVGFALAQGLAGRIVIVDLVEKRARRLAYELGRNFRCEAIGLKSDKKGVRELILNSDILINATPCGMKSSDPQVVDPRYLRRNLLCVYDLIYNPKVTPLIRAARQRRITALNGLGMLLYQGVEAFRLWTGRRPPVEIMRRALIKLTE